MKKPKVKTKLDLEKITTKLQVLRRYSFVVFVLLVVGVYAFILLRITNLSSVEPTDDSVNGQVQASHLVIDKTIVDQLKSLQDNSVNVQSLFDQARTSPFQEKN
jgi:hypothetical protein